MLIDIREDDLLALSAEVLDTLLRDHTTGKNIFWATHDYEALGSEYDYHAQILPSLITGEHGMVIRPRVLKPKEQQTDRAKDMAEVFTPSWVCNAQNNLVDEAWFGRKDVFNVEDHEKHTWKPNPLKIEFPKDKTWKDYLRATRMEMTCGEAPYLVSRYDATTGEPIPLEQRIGLLDRKLRVISENVDVSGEWLEWAQIAYKNIYGFESERRCARLVPPRGERKDTDSFRRRRTNGSLPWLSARRHSPPQRHLLPYPRLG